MLADRRFHPAGLITVGILAVLAALSMEGAAPARFGPDVQLGPLDLLQLCAGAAASGLLLVGAARRRSPSLAAWGGVYGLSTWSDATRLHDDLAQDWWLRWDGEAPLGLDVWTFGLVVVGAALVAAAAVALATSLLDRRTPVRVWRPFAVAFAALLVTGAGVPVIHHVLSNLPLAGGFDVVEEAGEAAALVTAAALAGSLIPDPRRTRAR